MQITKQWKINLTCKWGNIFAQNGAWFSCLILHNPVCESKKPFFPAIAITLASGHQFVITEGLVEGFIFIRHQSFSVPSANLFCSAWNARGKVSISQPARLEMLEKVSNSQQRPLAIKNFPASWICTAEHLFCGTPPLGAPVRMGGRCNNDTATWVFTFTHRNLWTFYIFSPIRICVHSFYLFYSFLFCSLSNLCRTLTLLCNVFLRFTSTTKCYEKWIRYMLYSWHFALKQFDTGSNNWNSITKFCLSLVMQ